METQGHLIVDVARLSASGEKIAGETREDLLDLGEEDLLVPLGGIKYVLRVEALGSELLVQGEVSQRIKCACTRCGAVFECDVVDSDFVCAVEINALTEFVDLTAEIREAIILALPGYPVCRTDCKGLCTTCGANLNITTCSCRQSGQEGRWAALDALP